MNHFLNMGHCVVWNDYLRDTSNTEVSSVWQAKKKSRKFKQQMLLLFFMEDRRNLQLLPISILRWRGVVPKQCIPGVSRKVSATKIKKWAEANLHHFGLLILYKVITVFTLLVSNLLFGFHFTSFVCVCLHFFFYTSWNSFKIKVLCQPWTGTGKGKTASFL